MGQKITIDSATMMNKALEIIEARWLFDLPPEQIDVVDPPAVDRAFVGRIHRRLGGRAAQSARHEAADSVRPDLARAAAVAGQEARSDAKRLRLDFEPPDDERFPALRLGREVAAAGGTAGAVLNAANEAAVASFLAGEMPFTEIVPACRAVLESHTF